jgi:hypothetical protein
MNALNMVESIVITTYKAKGLRKKQCPQKLILAG